ncbi:helix-turn-helix domain-containing protein [Cryobacterium breve]|uniref:helix-turn-helix domain-containing protein n=1 Tax=Cryobacterium breve TaxID=1259258 RepID=UPI00248C09FB|nr:LysR family transcriptional regulator [Cryobacterium breve]
MDTTLLRRFVTTAEATNWGAAAKTLNMTRATLLISIRKLEEEVGGELFVTVDDVPTLTSAGLEPARGRASRGAEARSTGCAPEAEPGEGRREGESLQGPGPGARGQGGAEAQGPPPVPLSGVTGPPDRVVSSTPRKGTIIREPRRIDSESVQRMASA